MDRRALQRAVQLAGGQAALARALGVKQAHIWYWLNRAKELPGKHVLAIERATQGRVSRHALRPDLYPEHEP